MWTASFLPERDELRTKKQNTNQAFANKTPSWNLAGTLLFRWLRPYQHRPKRVVVLSVLCKCLHIFSLIAATCSYWLLWLCYTCHHFNSFWCFSVEQPHQHELTVLLRLLLPALFHRGWKAMETAETQVHFQLLQADLINSSPWLVVFVAAVSLFYENRTQGTVMGFKAGCKTPWIRF